jgi:hypothetical protein
MASKAMHAIMANKNHQFAFVNFIAAERREHFLDCDTGDHFTLC